MTEIITKLIKESIPELKVRENTSLASLTSFRTGGPADIAAFPKNSGELTGLLSLLGKEGISFYILGNGSNVLAPDEGYRGVVILTGEMNGITVDAGSKKAVAGAGTLLATLSSECAKQGLSGLEFARGIPGSVGGAVVMNAGAYGGEIRVCLTEVTVCDGKGGRPFVMQAGDLEFSYRHSIIPEKGLIVLDATFGLEPGDKDRIYAMMDEFSAKRKEKQPLEYPSAGSTFKRPEGYFAGKLIEDAGLKGFSVGGAQVSEKHAGFVINKGGATSADILELIGEVQKRVFESSGVRLEPEVRFM